ncbi:MAG TPA: hypothetical protein VLK25_02320 [Allosphingosinicella sp.]|nr:hypothetical protein [Allosphingosinicella sp.]
MITTLQILLAAGTANVQQPPTAAPAPPIVVTGRRLPDYRDALAACLARNCPPNEDIDATLALAEAALLEGRYGEARAAVRASMSRNRRHAGNFPEPVSDLYRAGTRLAEHLGRDTEAERYAYQILASLREGLPVEDHRHFTARLEIVQSLTSLGKREVARRELRRLEDAARAAGREDVANIAQLRGLWLDYMVAPQGQTRRRLIEMSHWTDPARRLLAHGAKAMLIRIYSREGDDERVNAILAEMPRGASRQLLFSPPYQLVQQADIEGVGRRANDIYEPGLPRMANLEERLTINYEDSWIDVGFWIQPDGRVEDLQVMRRGQGSGWAGPLLQSIGGRRYTPGAEPSYRLERYTLTATLHNTATGTHIADRSPRGRVEFLDLTERAQRPPQAAN